MGKLSAYEGPLEVAKKSHMVGPVGNTELGGRWRRVHHLQVAYEEAVASSKEFRESAAPYRLARSRRNFAYGVLRSEIRLLTSVVEPANASYPICCSWCKVSSYPSALIIRVSSLFNSARFIIIAIVFSSIEHHLKFSSRLSSLIPLM